MIVVDSPVWMADLRGFGTAAARKLRASVDDGRDLMTGDLMLLEILRRARDEVHAGRIERNLLHHDRDYAAMADQDLLIGISSI